MSEPHRDQPAIDVEAARFARRLEAMAERMQQSKGKDDDVRTAEAAEAIAHHHFAVRCTDPLQSLQHRQT